MRKTDAEIKVEGMETGYIINCLIKRKEGDDSEVLFRQHGEGQLKDVVICYLDGYAVIPIEEYKELTRIK